MDNKIVSTTYVPLQPPFQIIKYSNDIAMQIGTLIVTIQKEGNLNGLGYMIETHSHPVVSYENKYLTKANHQLTAYRFLEGAVWNFVEVKDVMTICLSDARLPWQEFVDFLWRDMEWGKKKLPFVFSYGAIDKLCAGIEAPPNKHYVVKFEKVTPMYGEKKTIIRTRQSDIIAFITENTDIDKIKNDYNMTFASYSVVLSYLRNPNRDLTITYETDEDDLRQFVQFLNSSNHFTKPFDHVLKFGKDFLDNMMKR